MLALKRQKSYKVEIAKRTSASTWGNWEDITRFLIERNGDISIDLDDVTLRGRVQQNSCIFKFNNRTGAFNPEGTEGSMWNGTSEYMYHSRFRYYESYASEASYNETEEVNRKPLIDGLIATFPDYKEDMTCTLTINSRLDILRNHYILENVIGRSKRASSQAIIKEVIDLFDNTYAELGIETTGGIFRKEIFYDDITPYDQNLLDQMNQSISDGGGIGGLRLYDNKLFFTYFGNEKTTRANFEDDANCIGLWLFDETDYNGGTGTTIVDKTGDGHTLTTDNSFSNNWRSGFFDYAARTWYKVLSSEFVGLQDHTIELIIKINKNRALPTEEIEAPGTASELLINNTYPLFIWTTNNSSDLQCVTWRTNVPPNNNVQYEGLAINSFGDISYIYGDSPFNATTNLYGNRVAEESVKVGALGEGFYQYITLTVNHSDKTVKLYLNGKLQKAGRVDNLGSVYNSSKNKIVGCGFAEDAGEAADIWHDNLVDVSYSSIKLSNSEKSESEIFQQYEKIFGTLFDASIVNNHIMDNFSNGNIFNIARFESGEQLIKNYIILIKNESELGSTIFTAELESAFSITITIQYDNSQVAISVSPNKTIYNLITSFNSSDTLQSLGLSLEYIGDYFIEGETRPYCIKIISDGSTDFRKYGVVIWFYDGASSYPVYTQWENIETSTDLPTTILMPDGDNQTVFAKDDNSILKYGKRIKRMENFNLIDSALEKIDQLEAQLEQDKDPKARMIIEVPFNYAEIDIFDQVEVRLDPKTDAFKNEIGHYKSWSETDGYRYKNFYCVGIRHKKDGKSTVLKLLEKIV